MWVDNTQQGSLDVNYPFGPVPQSKEKFIDGEFWKYE